MNNSHATNLLPFPHIAEKSILSTSPSHAPCQLSVMQQLERVAPSEATVLLIGETGTGKELSARQIHERSGRGGPFVAVNCGAFNDSLAEAELFGHEASAFTGAQHARPGWFEAAHGGTLFLDEVGDMPLHLQVKLLRVLQERHVVRLGSRKPIAVDVRIIAATNVDLEAAVEERRFRRDLYYRLNVVNLRLSPLRERRGEIVSLARHFLDKYAKGLGVAPPALSAGAIRALTSHPWPGNVRELENVMQVALLMRQSDVLDAADLRIADGGAGAGAVGDGIDAHSGGTTLRDLRQSVQRLLDDGDVPAVYETVERVLLETAFEHCRGNQVRTARRLGVSRNVVRAQLKRFGLLPVEIASDSVEDAVAMA